MDRQKQNAHSQATHDDGKRQQDPAQAPPMVMEADLSKVEGILASTSFVPDEQASIDGKVESENEPQGTGSGPEPNTAGLKGGGEDGGEGGGSPEEEGLEGPQKEGDEKDADAGGEGGENGGLDASGLAEAGDKLGVDLSGVGLRHDDAAAREKGAKGFVEDGSEVVLGDEGLENDGTPNADVVNHEAVHLAQMMNGGGGAGVGDLEGEAQEGAAALGAGQSFAPQLGAAVGGALTNDTAQPAAAEKVTIGPDVTLSFEGNSITVAIPTSKQKVAKDEKQTINISGAKNQPEWMKMSGIVLNYEGDKLLDGKAQFRFVNKELNKHVKVSPVGGGSSRVGVKVDSGANVTVGDAFPAMRFDLKGLGQVEISDMGIDTGGLKYTATLTTDKLKALTSNSPGGKVKESTIKGVRTNGKLEISGGAKAEISKGGKKVLEGELKLNDRGTSVEGEGSAKFNANFKALSSVELKGKYSVDNGWDLSATAGKDLFGNVDKFNVKGQVQVSYSTKERKKGGNGVSFGGGIGATLKVSDKVGFEGEIMVGWLAELQQGLGAKGSLAVTGKPNENLELKGAVELVYGFEKGTLEGKGEPSATLFKHTTVKLPLEYKSDGSPKWTTQPELEIKNYKIPGMDKKKEKKYEPTLPRMRVPLFGPLVLEGGPTFRLNAGLGPARVDKVTVKAEIDVDNGFDFKKADLKGKLVCPFYAEAAVGFMLGLGIDVVLASAGAGVELAIRAGLPADDKKNAVSADINASLVDGAGGKAGKFEFDAGVDITANLELLGDLNVYARYDTLFTRERIFRQNLASTRFASYGPIGASGKLSYKNKKLDADVEFKTPKLKGPDNAWVKSKFNQIRSWF